MTKRMGKYELGRVLGTGSFAKVRMGTDTTTGDVYAIKIIDKAQLAKERLEEQLKREIAILKILRHKHITSMKEVLQTNRHIYIVLELVDGGDLFDAIVQQQRFPEDLARRYFQQLVLGVRHCHMQGIAHRDLKPENLLLDATGNIKVSDFGLANLTTKEDDIMSTVCGTPNYVAPEVIKDRGYNGFIADVWSCGVILYVMLSGHQAFDDPNVKVLFNKIERGEYRMSRHFTDGARDLISKVLVVDPAQRYTLNQVMAHPWFQVGFDPSELAAASAIIQVSDAAISAAVGEGGADPTSPQAGTMSSGEDAFQIAQRLMTAALAPMSKQATSGAGATGPISTANHRALMYRGAADAAFDDVQAALKAMAPNVTPGKGDRGNVELKAFVNAKRGLLTFLVELTPTSEPFLTLVELKKGRGDVLDFQEVVLSLHHVLGPKAASMLSE